MPATTTAMTMSQISQRLPPEDCERGAVEAGVCASCALAESNGAIPECSYVLEPGRVPAELPRLSPGSALSADSSFLRLSEMMVYHQIGRGNAPIGFAVLRGDAVPLPGGVIRKRRCAIPFGVVH